MFRFDHTKSMVMPFVFMLSAFGTVSWDPVAAMAQSSDAAPADTAATLAFKNSVDAVPPGAGKVFKLSADYPATMPSNCPDCGWLSLEVDYTPTFPPDAQKTDWKNGGWDNYLSTILNYVRMGQDDNLSDAAGFRTEINGKTRWFNVPWMAYDEKVGREYRHGTTNERTAELQDLVGPDGKLIPDEDVSIGATHFLPEMNDSCKARFPNGFETWSVGYYNELGGYAIGQAIPKDGVPRAAEFMGSPIIAGLPFPQGTAVVKILTTNAPADCVPFLKNSPEWKVNRHVMDDQSKKYLCRREVQLSRIVQIDVAVTDARSPTGWLYGTFAYNGNMDGKTFWDRLEPLGVQWGADPWSFPAVPREASLALQQSVANPTKSIFEHMGCGGRLAGPVDNPQSSCLSCHGSAFTPKPGAIGEMGVNVPPAFGFDGLCSAYSADNASYFQNTRPPQTFPGGKYSNLLSLDTSLQLEVAMQQYALFQTNKQATPCEDE